MGQITRFGNGDNANNDVSILSKTIKPGLKKIMKPKLEKIKEGAEKICELCTQPVGTSGKASGRIKKNDKVKDAEGKIQLKEPVRAAPVREKTLPIEYYENQAREYHKQADSIQRKMIALISGNTGMVSILNIVKTANVEKDVYITYIESFLERQNYLKKLYAEYQRVKEECNNLPQKSVKKINELRNEELYRDLMEVDFVMVDNDYEENDVGESDSRKTEELISEIDDNFEDI